MFELSVSGGGPQLTAAILKDLSINLKFQRLCFRCKWLTLTRWVAATPRPRTTDVLTCSHFVAHQVKAIVAAVRGSGTFNVCFVIHAY